MPRPVGAIFYAAIDGGLKWLTSPENDRPRSILLRRLRLGAAYPLASGTSGGDACLEGP